MQRDRLLGPPEHAAIGAEHAGACAPRPDIDRDHCCTDHGSGSWHRDSVLRAAPLCLPFEFARLHCGAQHHAGAPAPAPCTFLKRGVRPATSSGGNRGRGRWSAGEHARSPALARTSTHPGAPNRPTNCSGGSHVRRHTCQPPAASRPWYLRVKRRMMREAEVPPGDYGREDGGHDRILDRSKCGPSGELPIRKVTTPAPVDGDVAGRTPDERRQLVPWAQEAERDRRATGPGRAPGARCRG